MVFDDELIKKIRFFTLENALKFKGKANPKAVFGKVLSQNSLLKEHRTELFKVINDVLQDVNKLNSESQQEEFAKLRAEVNLEKKEKKTEGLKELDNPKDLVMRFAPSPSGPLHIGHALTGGIISLYTEKYNGKYLLRIEDTNADNILPEAYDMIKEDADWAFGNVSEVWVQSDRMQIYYNYLKKLILEGNAYVCTCKPEEFKEYSNKMKNCPCRSLSIDEHLQRYEKMLDANGYDKGEAVIRFRGSMQHKNPAMRDFPLARINTTEHPRQGTRYKLWPLMNLSVTVDDIEGNITHIIRGKDHYDNAKRQEMIYKALGKKPPYTYFQGKINFIGFEMSTTKTKEKIRQGLYKGWDDIRLPTLRALKRRGYQPEAIKNFIKQINLSLNDKTVTFGDFFKSLDAFNKAIVEPIAKRFFFVIDPIKITVKGAPEKTVELDLHPDNIKGGRPFVVGSTYYIAADDYYNIKEGEIIRLMDNINIKKETDGFSYVSESYTEFKDLGNKILHWINDGHKAKLLMPDGNFVSGLVEKNIDYVNQDEIVQFERVGFCRLDNKEKLEFWFTHK